MSRFSTVVLLTAASVLVAGTSCDNEPTEPPIEGPPTAPTGVQAAPLSESEIQITWKDNSSDETYFVIERRSSAPPTSNFQLGFVANVAGSWEQVGTVGENVTTFTDDGLSEGTLYFYQVIACNSPTCLGASSEVSEEGWSFAVTYPGTGTITYSAPFVLTGPGGLEAAIDIGTWMYGPDPTAADWPNIADWALGKSAGFFVSSPYSPDDSDAYFRLLEPINVVWADFSAESKRGAYDNVVRFLQGPLGDEIGPAGCSLIPEDNVPSTTHTDGYRAWVEGDFRDQGQLGSEPVTFVDRVWPNENNHGRIFESVPVGDAYITVASFSRESELSGVTGHYFRGFNRARNRLNEVAGEYEADPACENPVWEDRGRKQLPNIIHEDVAEANGLGYTTAKHDGTLLFVRGVKPDLVPKSVVGAEATVGQTVSVGLTVAEQAGVRSFSPDFAVRLFLSTTPDLEGDPTLICEDYPASLGSYSVDCLIPEVLPNDYYVVAWVDAGMQVEETEEFNNILASEARYSISEGAAAWAFEGISAGQGHTCGWQTDGTAYCWGNGDFGALGGGSPTLSRTSPTLVSGGRAFELMTTGNAGLNTCGLETDGTAYCWGWGVYGQLGDGTATSQTTPTEVFGGYVFASISAGGLHTCGPESDGTAYCWGGNWEGQLGDGTMTSRDTASLVSGGHAFVSLATGNDHTCGLETDGTAYCWGANYGGQLGIGTETTTGLTTPTEVLGGHVFVSLVAGAYHTCGMESDGTAYCWGANGYGQIGDGTTTTWTNRLTPTQVSGGHAFVLMAAGDNHTCGLESDGTAYCWGWNMYGQLGDGTDVDRLTPTLVSGGHAFESTTAGEVHTCGLESDGTAYCWGANYSGQVGDGTTDNRRLTPTRVVR